MPAEGLGCADPGERSGNNKPKETLCFPRNVEAFQL